MRNHGLKAGTRFRAFLTSDYIGRDPKTGQIDPSWFTEEIHNHFGKNQVKVLWPRWAFRLVGGYNRAWGLQLPQVLALRAGSILVMEAQQTIPHADLLAIEQTGLGERRTEGFGRVLFLAEESHSVDLRSVASSFASVPSLPVPDLVNVMQRRILMDAIERQIAGAAADLARDATQIPSPSLLGRLRVPLRGNTPDPLGTLRQWLEGNDHQRLRRLAMKQLDACRIKSPVDGKARREALSDWLRQIIATDSVASLSELLNFPRTAQKHYIESEDAAKKCLTEAETLLRTRVRLIDEVLALLARRKRLAAREGQHADNQ